MVSFFDYLAENHLALGIVSLMCWITSYFFFTAVINGSEYMKQFPRVSRVFVIESCVSAIQGFVCGGIGVLAILYCKEDVMGLKYAPLDHYCVIGAGYFTYDLGAMYYSNKKLLVERHEYKSFLHTFKMYIKKCGLMIAHHIILCAVLFPALITFSPMGHFFAGCFFCMELSSPFTNFRIVLSKLGLKATKLYLYNGIFMMIVFAIFRVIIFLYMYGVFVHQMAVLKSLTYFGAFRTIPLICHFCSFIVLSPQIYWLSMMINGVYLVLAKQPKALEKYE